VKKLSNIVASNTQDSFKRFISEKVLNDPEIVKFIQRKLGFDKNAI